MSTPLIFPKKIFFYPIGNTSAVCLTQDLAPEEPADILLLGCGDARNILYTIYNRSVALPRKLDFTCCDLETAVLARNVLLLTMVADNQDLTKIWNIFFHIYLDKPSLVLLFNQCRILIDVSESLQTWQNSKYATFLKMCTSRTLAELRRHWSLYVKTEELSRERIQSLRNSFQAVAKTALGKYKTNLTASRSAGPLVIQAAQVTPEHFQHFWKTGITSVNPKDVTAATFLNPTFMYSAFGEGFSVHYGTDPLIPFHLASVFASPSPTTITITDVVTAAKAQFRSWCDAFKASVTSDSSAGTIIRIFAGDALAFCHALQYCASNKSTETDAYTAPWTASTINLDGGNYTDGQAPTTFNVIDTSNLTDHVGLLNVLIATVPVLSRSPSSVLYTEALLPSGEDATTGFTDRVCADVPAISLVLGLMPNSYTSGFTTHSNAHEILMRFVASKNSQFREHITWKNPALGDNIAITHDPDLRRLSTFNDPQLAEFLFGIYLKMFSNEDLGSMMRKLSLEALQERSLIYYIRETFVLLVKLMKSRVEADWKSVMERFLDLVETERTLLMGPNNQQELYCQLRFHGVYSADIYQIPTRAVGRFKDWDVVPPLVYVTLNIPREKIKVLENMNADQLGTPILHCETRGITWHNIFSSIRVAFGRVTLAGSKGKPEIIVEEDPAGWSGKSALIASFWMPSWLLTKEPHTTRFSLSVRCTPASVMILTAKLGMEMSLFTTQLMDETHIHVVPGHPSLSQNVGNSVDPQQIHHCQIGRHSPVHVVLDEGCRKVATLAIKVDVEEPTAKSAFSGGTEVRVAQTSPCVMTLSFAAFKQQLVFPFPVIGSRSKLRIARKSLYIEVLVPISGPFLPDGYSINPFPVVIKQKTINAWNIHRVNLDRLPALDTTRPAKLDWFNTHIGMMMSDRERDLRDREVQTDVLMNLKDSLHTIFIMAAGVQGTKSRTFILVNDDKIDTLIFVTDLRLDLSSHTTIADGCVLPLTKDVRSVISQTLRTVLAGAVRITMFGDELRAWKQILPAFTERCRQWKHNDSCDYLSKGSIPLSEESDQNPLCGCGRGMDVDAFLKIKEWRKLAPFVTRIALGPLFSVSYLESIKGRVGKQPFPRVDSPISEGKCAACGGSGKPKLLVCSKCKKITYCSAACQKEDWRASHKNRCKSFAPA